MIVNLFFVKACGGFWKSWKMMDIYNKASIWKVNERKPETLGFQLPKRILLVKPRDDSIIVIVFTVFIFDTTNTVITLSAIKSYFSMTGERVCLPHVIFISKIWHRWESFRFVFLSTVCGSPRTSLAIVGSDVKERKKSFTLAEYLPRWGWGGWAT